jgi:hypothetical protein
MLFLFHSGNAKHWLRLDLLSRRNAASKGGESLAMEDSFFYLFRRLWRPQLHSVFSREAPKR